MCLCMQHSEHMALGRRKRAMVVRSSRMLALAPLALAATLSGVKGVSVAHVALASRGPPLAPHNSVRGTGSCAVVEGIIRYYRAAFKDMNCLSL